MSKSGSSKRKTFRNFNHMNCLWVTWCKNHRDGCQHLRKHDKRAVQRNRYCRGNPTMDYCLFSGLPADSTFSVCFTLKMTYYTRKTTPRYWSRMLSNYLEKKIIIDKIIKESENKILHLILTMWVFSNLNQRGVAGMHTRETASHCKTDERNRWTMIWTNRFISDACIGTSWW